MGIVNPYLGRSVGTNGTLQLSEINSVTFGVSYGLNRRSNQGVGGYTLPDRASNGHEHYLDLYGKMISVFSSRTIYETTFEAWRDHDENTPVTDAVSIDVLGGVQQRRCSKHTCERLPQLQFRQSFFTDADKIHLESGIVGKSYPEPHVF